MSALNLQSLQHILTAQMISSVHEGELCRSLRYLAEFTELTEAEVNNLSGEARSFVLAGIRNEEAGNALQWYRLADAEQLRSNPVKYCFLRLLPYRSLSGLSICWVSLIPVRI